MATRQRRTSAEPRRGITRLSVEGFKSLRSRQEIEIRPLTVLAGANSSGKSSIVQPLLLLKQTLEVPYDPGPLLLDGPNVSVTSVSQILSRRSGRIARAREFFFGIELDGDDTSLRFGRSARGDLVIREMRGTRGGRNEVVTLREGMAQEELLSQLSRETVGRVLGFLDSSDMTLGVTRDRCFLDIGLLFKDDGVSEQWPSPWASLQRSPRLEDALTRVVHLPALRGNPRRTYRTVAVEDRYPGTFDTYTAGVISAWQNRGREDLLDRLWLDLEELGLTWTVEARKIDDTQVELVVGRLVQGRRSGARDVVNIADVGFGVSQTLPVVVALLAAGPGQLVYLEQPEIHLHPRAQVALAPLLVRAVERGSRVLVETHSGILLRSLQTVVADGKLSPDLVALHWFKRDPVSGFTEVIRGQLDQKGAYGDWPEDFDEVVLTAEQRYLDAAAGATGSAE